MSVEAPARFAYTVVASRLHGSDAVAEMTAPARALLESIGGHQIDADDRVVAAPLVFLVATSGTERMVLDALARQRVAHGDEPTILVARRGHNSLSASLETLAAVQQSGGRGRIVCLSGEVDRDRRDLEEAVGDIEAVRRLRATRLGVVGGPSTSLVASSPDADVVRDRWGPELVTVDPTRMIELTRTPVVPTGSLAEQFTRVADPVRSTVGSREVDTAVRVRAALGDVFDDHDLDAVTVRCAELLGDPGTSGCLALGEPQRRRNRRRL